jgi:hypothetical protein
MIKAGQRVIVDFGSQVYSGKCLRDCADWGSQPLVIRDDEDGEITYLKTWLAHDVEVMETPND